MGIDFNSLPSNLQAKIKPYLAVAGSVENAIEAAKLNGKWSEADDAKLASLNGGANFGRLDGFESKKAKTYKYEAAKNAKPNQNMAKSDNSAAVGLGFGAVAGAVAGTFIAGPGWGTAIGAVVGGTILSTVACQEKNETIVDTDYNTENTINVKMVNDFSRLENLIKEGNDVNKEFFKQILNELKTVVKNQEIGQAQLSAYVDLILKALGTNNELVATLINAVGDNRDLLKIMIDKLTAGQNALADLKNKIVENHEDDLNYQKQALELLANIKSTVDGLGNLGPYYQQIVNNMIKQGEDVESIKAYVKQITENTEVLKDFAAMDLELGNQILKAIKNVKIGDVNVDLTAVLEAIKQNGQNLGDIKKLLVTINTNVENGNAQAKELGERTINTITILGSQVAYDLNRIYEKIPTNKDYSVVLDGILAELKKMGKDNKNNFENVIKAIANKQLEPQDLTWLKEHLNEILAAIKDHDVLVTVDCKCSCSEGSPHEGIIGNLNKILG